MSKYVKITSCNVFVFIIEAQSCWSHFRSKTLSGSSEQGQEVGPRPRAVTIEVDVNTAPHKRDDSKWSNCKLK